MDIKNILIVDDTPELAQVLSDSLNQHGFSTLFFTAPKNAIDYVIANHQEIDLIISDFHMPELTGLQMMREIHQIKKIPYILLSGALFQIEDKYSLMQIDRISKPFRIKNVVNSIRSHTTPLLKVGS